MGLGWLMPTAASPSGISSLSIQDGAFRVAVLVTGIGVGAFSPHPTSPIIASPRGRISSERMVSPWNGCWII
jgi:hypothetical protein